MGRLYRRYYGHSSGRTALPQAARHAGFAGRRRYRAGRRDRKHRLLGDKYYHDSKYHRKL